MASLRTAAFALALLGSTMMIGQASAAMPVNGLTPAKAQIGDNVQDVRWWGPGWRYGRWGYGYRRWGYGYGRGWGYRHWAWGYGPGWRGCGWHRCWW
jgi:hypothetical protein